MIEHEPSSIYQVHPRFYVDWKGHQEDDFYVCDGLNRIALTCYSSQHLGTRTAQKMALADAAKRNAAHYSSDGIY